MSWSNIPFFSFQLLFCCSWSLLAAAAATAAVAAMDVLTTDVGRSRSARPPIHEAHQEVTTYYQGHAWPSWFSPTGMTLCSSSLKMAITILMSMTQRTRNHGMEFILFVMATAGLRGVTRKVTLLYHHCLPLQGGLGVHGHTLLTKQTHLPSNSPAAGLAKDSFCEHWATDQSRERVSCHMARQHLLSSQVVNPEGWCWGPEKPSDIAGRSTCLVHLGWGPNLLSLKPSAIDTFSWDDCWKQQIMDLLIYIYHLRLCIRLVTNVPSFISLVLRWCEIAKEKNQIVCNTLCKQKDEGKRERITDVTV